MDPRNLELAKQLRHELHEHPEVSNHESWTKQHLIDFLKAHTKLEIVDRGAWFYAVYRSGQDACSARRGAQCEAIGSRAGQDEGTICRSGQDACAARRGAQREAIGSRAGQDEGTICRSGQDAGAAYRSGEIDGASSSSEAGQGKANIAFRADFDALPMDEGISLPWGSKFPGVAHKCGHDGHCASLAAFALEVDQKGADKDIFFLFQHAEETGDGAAQCVAFIKENNIDEIFAFHNGSGIPLKSVSVIDGTCNCASKGMTIHMEGTPAHASQPEAGVNPAFAIAKIIDAIPELISPERNRGMVLCTVIQVDVGERAFGMSASRGDLLLTIRAYYEEEMDRLQAALEDLARSRAEKHGLKVSFSYNDVFPVTANHKESSDRIRKVCKEKGFQLLEMEDAHRGSEDFGHFLKLTKGALCYIGNGEDHPPIHTWQYDFPDEVIEQAVELFKALAGM